MKLRSTPIEGVMVVELEPSVDHRGKFVRVYCQREMGSLFKGRPVVQSNYSLNLRAGTIRGMHFQGEPFPESKFVTCVAGRIWDVALDLRKESTTYLKWFALELSADNSLGLFIPAGCAHGFQSLEDNSGLIYQHDEYFEPSAQSMVRFDDPIFNITWPLQPTAISERDRNAPFLR